MMVRKCLGFLSLSPVVANVPSRYISNSSHSCLVNCSDSYVMLLRGILADPFMQVSDFLTMEHKELLTHTDSLPKNGTGTAAAWLKQCRSQISRH